MSNYHSDLAHLKRIADEHIKNRNNRRAGHPGIPVSTIPMDLYPSLNRALNEGELVLIKRPSRQSPKTTIDYVAVPS